MLTTQVGPLFIDLETCCRGPVEFDLAHMPSDVSEHYPDVDHALLEDCRGLVLAVAKNRCGPGDEFPNGQQALLDLVSALRAGPPWPALDVVRPRLRDPEGGRAPGPSPRSDRVADCVGAVLADPG